MVKVKTVPDRGVDSSDVNRLYVEVHHLLLLLLLSREPLHRGEAWQKVRMGSLHC